MASGQAARVSLDAVELQEANGGSDEALADRRLSTISRASLDGVSAEELKSTITSKKAGPLPAWLLIITWIALSTGVSYTYRPSDVTNLLKQVIFQNASILKGGFPYPVTLTSMYMSSHASEASLTYQEQTSTISNDLYASIGEIHQSDTYRLGLRHTSDKCR